MINECKVTPPPRPSPLDMGRENIEEWGVIAVAAGLGLVGVLFVVRRKRAAI